METTNIFFNSFFLLIVPGHQIRPVFIHLTGRAERQLPAPLQIAVLLAQPAAMVHLPSIATAQRFLHLLKDMFIEARP